MRKCKQRVGPILDRLAAEHAGEDIVVVSHGGVMMTLWAYVARTWEAAHVPSNCGMVLIEHGRRGMPSPWSSMALTAPSIRGG